MASFLGIVENLLRDSDERVAYLDDPTRFLDSHGFGDFDTSTVATGLLAVAESLPPLLAQHIDPQAGLESVVAVDLADVVGLWARRDDFAGMTEDFGDPAFDSAFDDEPAFDIPDEATLGTSRRPTFDEEYEELDDSLVDVVTDTAVLLHFRPTGDVVSDSPDGGVMASEPVEIAETLEAPVPEGAEESGEAEAVDTSLEALDDIDLEEAGDPPWEVEEFGE